LEVFKIRSNRAKIGRHIRNALIIWGPILLIGVILPDLAFDSLAIHPLLGSVLALWLAGATLVTAFAIGAGILNIIRVEFNSQFEHALFAMPLGLGAVSLTIFVLGLLGLLIPLVILLMMFGLSVLAGREIDGLISEVPQLARSSKKRWHEASIPIRLLLIAGFIVAALSLLQALLPPIGYDGLYYHLPIPKLYLESGRIYPTPEFTPAGFPLLGEMLFIVGMAVGSDTFSQLMNLVFAVLLAAATIKAGQRWAKPFGGWIAGAMLLGMPIISIWATLPYVDFAWALFEFLGVYALLLWGERMRASNAILAGLMFGLALGTKYLALGGLLFIVLAAIIIWRRERLLTLARLIIPLIAAAVIVGAPWYIKNWIWYSNPVYPLLNGIFNPASGPLWTTRLSLPQLDPLYLLLLPISLFVNREHYVGVFGDFEFLNPLFLLIFAYPLTRNGRNMDRLAFMAFMRYTFWALTHSDLIRYLLPIISIIGIVSASVIQKLYQRVRNKGTFRVVLMGIGGGFVASSLAVSIIFFVEVRPLSVLMGWESRSSYLSRQLNDYSAIQYVNENLSHDDTVLMIYDARGYYCEERCIPDLLQNRWLNMLGTSPTPSSVAATLERQGITHLLYTREDAAYLISIDASGTYAEATAFLHEDFIPQCAEAVYQDESASVYKITCLDS